MNNEIKTFYSAMCFHYTANGHSLCNAFVFADFFLCEALLETDVYFHWRLRLASLQLTITSGESNTPFVAV